RQPTPNFAAGLPHRYLLPTAVYQASQLRHLLLIAVLETHRADEPVGAVHQIDIGRVHDGVGAVVLGDLVVEVLPASRRGSDLRLGAREADDARVKRGEILAQLFRRVALRVNANEYDGQAIGIRPQALQRIADCHKGRRTHVGAMRIAEEDDVGSTGQRRTKEGFAVVVDQLEGRSGTDPRLGHRWRAHRAADPRAQHETWS